MARKTHTSSEVKNRWNRKHYDQVNIRIPIGSKHLLQDMLEERGLSMAGYIKLLIQQDAQKCGYTELSERLGGGGVISSTTLDYWRSLGLISPSESVPQNIDIWDRLNLDGSNDPDPDTPFTALAVER